MGAIEEYMFSANTRADVRGTSGGSDDKVQPNGVLQKQRR